MTSRFPLRAWPGLVALALVAVAVACGGSNPTEPTPNPGGTPTGGAAGVTINGQLSTSSGTSGSTAGVASSRATPVSTVTVVGTSLATAADAAGRFTLSGVPAGTVQLHFSGSGTDANLTVGELRGGDTIALTIAVNGAFATVLADSRLPGGSAVPKNGIVRELTGTLASFDFTIDGERIHGDAVTEFYGHPNQTPAEVFALMNGLRAEVKAWPRSGGWYAERLHVNLEATPTPTPTPPPTDTSASIEGPLTAMAGSRPTLTLTIAGTTVRTSAATEVQRRGDTQDLSVLQIGMTIHVVGDRRGDGSIDARRLQIKDDETGGEFEIEGSLGGLKGSCPAITFGVNGFSVAATAATSFTPGCGELRNGNKVRVRGIRQADGSVRATSVTRQ